MATKGDKLTDFITAPWYNEVTKKLGIRTGAAAVSDPVRVVVYNHNTTAHKVWEPVALGSAKMDYTDYPYALYNEIAFNTQDLSPSDPDNIVILQEPMEGIVGASALALIMGMSWLRMPVAYSIAPYIQVGTGPALNYSIFGRIESIRDFDIGSEYLALVLIGALPRSTLYQFELTESFATGIADANITTMLDEVIGLRAIYDPQLIFAELGIGDTGYCIYQDGTFWAIQAPCADEVLP